MGTVEPHPLPPPHRIGEGERKKRALEGPRTSLPASTLPRNISLNYRRLSKKCRNKADVYKFNLGIRARFPAEREGDPKNNKVLGSENGKNGCTCSFEAVLVLWKRTELFLKERDLLWKSCKITEKGLH